MERKAKKLFVKKSFFLFFYQRQSVSLDESLLSFEEVLSVIDSKCSGMGAAFSDLPNIVEKSKYAGINRANTTANATLFFTTARR